MQPDVTRNMLSELRKQQQQIRIAAKEDEKKLSSLSVREREVLELLGNGYNNKEIATRLYISEGTVKNHISAIIRKLDLRDRTQAALFALKMAVR